MTEQQVAEAAARAGGEVVARYFRDFANVAHEVKAGEPSYNRVSVADLEYELSPWDFAAGRLFVEEAGGCVTTCNNHPLPLAKTHILASNGRLHQPMLDIVQRHLPK